MANGKAERLLKRIKRQERMSSEPITKQIAGNLILPNNSGEHQRGLVRETPTQDYDLVNKAYVDAAVGVKLNEVDNPDGDKTFVMTTRQLGFLFTNPAGNPIEFEASGAYTGALLHIHQHTGNPGATYLVELESSDTDVEHIKSLMPGATNHVLCCYVSGDTVERLVIHADGKLEWGPGGATAMDTNLYRSAANKLITDDALEVVGVATLADGSLLKTSAAPTTDAMIANKKYVDDNVGEAALGSQYLKLGKPQSVGQGTWTISTNTASWGTHIINGPPADSDNISYEFPLSAGTYTLQFFHRKHNNMGKIDVFIDANKVINAYDPYSAAPQEFQTYEESGVTVATSGMKTIKIAINGKNGASSGYTANWNAIKFVRTA
jgi:hypothetical protein